LQDGGHPIADDPAGQGWEREVGDHQKIGSVREQFAQRISGLFAAYLPERANGRHPYFHVLIVQDRLKVRNGFWVGDRTSSDHCLVTHFFVIAL
jgi:hypothetical protein